MNDPIFMPPDRSNVPLVTPTASPLTAVSVPPHEIGISAAQWLVESVRGNGGRIE